MGREHRGWAIGALGRYHDLEVNRLVNLGDLGHDLFREAMVPLAHMDQDLDETRELVASGRSKKADAIIPVAHYSNGGKLIDAIFGESVGRLALDELFEGKFFVDRRQLVEQFLGDLAVLAFFVRALGEEQYFHVILDLLE